MLKQSLAGARSAAQKGLDKVAPGFSVAAQIRGSAQERYESAARALDEQRQATGLQLEALGRLKIDVYDIELREFVDSFREIKNADLKELVDPNSPTMEAIEELDLKKIDFSAVDTIKTAVAAGGAGAAVGAGAYTTVMTFGAASAGTAISTLSGAAATNATLAWFGGGSLAAGGAGMAGGMVVLGGIVAIPVLAVGGLVVRSKGRAAVEAAKEDSAKASEARAGLEAARTVAHAIERRAAHTEEVLRRLRSALRPMVRDLNRLILRSNNYEEYDDDTRRQLQLWVTTALTTRNVLDTDLLDGNGSLTEASEAALRGALSFLEDEAPGE